VELAAVLTDPRLSVPSRGTHDASDERPSLRLIASDAPILLVNISAARRIRPPDDLLDRARLAIRHDDRTKLFDLQLGRRHIFAASARRIAALATREAE
jgi:hypothetical protein